MNKLARDFFLRDVLDTAPGLLGKILVCKTGGKILKAKITEVEAYRGEEDLACHASKGRTKRTEMLYSQGGCLYVYLIYGMYWMLNIVTGPANFPQAVLIRGVEGFDGPGKLTKNLNIDKSFHGKSIIKSKCIWIENNTHLVDYYTLPRVGIDYAAEIWKNKAWRFILK